MLNLLRRFSKFIKERRGVAALEFAMTAPILMLFMTGSYDVTQILVIQGRMSAASIAIAEMATSMSAATYNNGTNYLSGDNAELAATAVFSYLPQWENINQSLYSVTMTSIVMTQTDPSCTSNCSYTAAPKWSQSLNYGTANRRACLPLGQSPPLATSQATLPAGLFGPAPLLAVDITFKYKPIFLGFLTGNITITRSAFLNPRIGGYSNYVIYQIGSIPAAASPTALGYVICP